MFVEPMRFAKEFTQPGEKKMSRLMMKDPVKKAEADIQYHNKKVGFEVSYIKPNLQFDKILFLSQDGKKK